MVRKSRAFQGQQAALFFEAASVPGEAAVRAHHPVAGDQEGNAVVAHRAADRLRGQVGLPPLPGELRGDFAIGGGAAIGDLPQKLPYILLKSVPMGWSGGKKSGFCPAKYASSQRAVSCRMGVCRSA